MWEITSEKDDRWVFVLEPNETFDEMSDAKKKALYESALYMKRKVELAWAEDLEEICCLAKSLTEEEWSQLPQTVSDFLLPYRQFQIEEDDDD